MKDILFLASLAWLLLSASVAVQAQNNVPETSAPRTTYRFERQRSTVFAINPVHLAFSHATAYLDFFNARKSRASTRIVVSFGLNEERRRYRWAAALERKYYIEKHYKPASFFFGPGLVGGLIYARTKDYKGVWSIGPEALVGFQFQAPKSFNMSLEGGVGLPLVFDGGYYEPDNPFVFSLGLLIGFRGISKP